MSLTFSSSVTAQSQINLRCRFLQTTLLTNLGIRPSNLCRYVLLIYSIFFVFVDIVKNKFWERENRHVFKCFIAALAVIQRMIIGERSPCLLVNSSGVYFGGNWVSLVNRNMWHWSFQTYILKFRMVWIFCFFVTISFSACSRRISGISSSIKLGSEEIGLLSLRIFINAWQDKQARFEACFGYVPKYEHMRSFVNFQKFWVGWNSNKH